MLKSIIYAFGLASYFLFSFLPLFSQSSSQTSTKEQRFVPGEVILCVKPEFRSKMRQNDLLFSSIQRAKNPIKITEIKQMYPNHQPNPAAKSATGLDLVDLSRLYNIKFDSNIPVSEVIQTLAAENVYEFVEPRYIAHSFYVPNDPNQNTTAEVGGLAFIRAYEAWDTVKGNNTVICGIVDTGYKTGNTDLDPNLTGKTTEINGNGIDDDGNGKIDDFFGWDMADNDATINYPGNPFTHGYDVATIYGSVADNATAFPGIGFNCGFRIIKAAPNSAPGNISHGYEGIIYAADNGCQIINCSWGSPDYSSFGEIAVNYATMNKGCAVIVAAGNKQYESLFYPAGFRNSLSVTSCSITNISANSFHYTVDLNSLRSDYTSFTAPVVSAAVALTYRRFNQQRGDPTFTAYQAAQRVRTTAIDNYASNPTKIDKIGKGRMDMFDPVRIALKMPSVRVSSHTPTITIGDGDLEIESGETVSVATDFINWLDPTTNLMITVTPDAVCSPYITMGINTLSAGAMAKLGTASQAFTFTVNSNAPADLAVGLRVTYSDPLTSYTDFEYISLLANNNILNITDNLLDMSVSGKGNWGYKDSPNNTVGMGVKYNGSNNMLYEGGLLIGKSATLISNNIRKSDGSQDMDFYTAKRILPKPSPLGSDFEANAYFTDTASTTPLGVKVKYNVYNYTDVNNDDYQVFEYLIKNSTASSLTGLYASVFADWDIVSNTSDPFAYAKNRCSFDATKKWMYNYQNGYSDYLAIALLTDDSFKARAYRGSTLNTSSFTDAGKFAAISNTPDAATATIATDDDIMEFVGAGPFDIAAGQTYRLAFAIIGGNNLTTMNQVRLDAIKNYFCQIVGRVPANTVAQTLRTSDMEEGDAEGWSHYYKSGASNELLLSVKKDAAVSFTPANVAVGYGSSPYYSLIDPAVAPYAANAPTGWYTMNRFWNITPAVQPASPVGLRMYYTQADFTALQTNCVGLLTHNDLQFFKFRSAAGINPNPLLGHTGATLWDWISLPKTIGTIGTSGNNYFAEMSVSSFSGGGGGDSGSGLPLPVEGLAFDANLTPYNYVKLTWTTAKEWQNAYFEIERSADGKLFDSLGKITPGNNPNNLQNYEYTDFMPQKGLNYYRLKQVDLNGAMTYSEIKSVLLENSVEVQIYPNPIHNDVHIGFPQSWDYANIRILDALGKLVFEKEIHASQETISLSSLPTGTYFVQIYSDGLQTVRKIEKE